MSNIRKFTITEDYEWGEDGKVTTLSDESGKEILNGDWYHDKIEDKIDGFFACLDYLGIKYEKTVVQVNIESEAV